MINSSSGKPGPVLVEEALASARSLVLYRGILQDRVCRAMLRFLAAAGRAKDDGLLQAYGELFFLLGQEAVRPGDAWQNHLLDLVLYDDNPFTRGAASTDQLSASLHEAALGDLRRLHNLFRVDAEAAREAVVNGGPEPPGGLSRWRDLAASRPGVRDGDPAGHVRTLLREAPDWERCLDDLTAYHRQAGAGLLARYRALRWVNPPGCLEGIGEPDPVTFDDLIGYHPQRQEIMKNTERFLAGLPANNLLLYGDRGTGKSSTVKALLNHYRRSGLRLVEVFKRDLADFPRIARGLRRHPQRFVLFVDDLSFEEDETGYKELKAALEGSLEGRPANVLIYATSNRRHLVRERFADRQPEYREDGEVRAGDTVQEKLSLADRFGITVLFMTPDKTLYLEIVRGLARQKGISWPEEELDRRALLWEAWQNGRSGRSARQFVDSICGEEGLPAGQGTDGD